MQANESDLSESEEYKAAQQMLVDVPIKLPEPDSEPAAAGSA